MPEPRREYHLHDDLSLTPAYVLGYAFHALTRIDAQTPVHGRRGAAAHLTELLATVSALGLKASLAVAEPLRVAQQSLSSSPRSGRVGSASAAHVLTALTAVEEAVRSELRARGTELQPLSRSMSQSVRVLLGEVALARCPHGLRAEVSEGCRALDAQLYTAAVFHFYRVWDQLPAPVLGPVEGAILDPRVDSAVQSTRADAVGLLGAIRTSLENASTDLRAP